jgi:hypothetical protein
VSGAALGSGCIRSRAAMASSNSYQRAARREPRKASALVPSLLPVPAATISAIAPVRILAVEVVLAPVEVEPVAVRTRGRGKQDRCHHREPNPFRKDRGALRALRHQAADDVLNATHRKRERKSQRTPAQWREEAELAGSAGAARHVAILGWMRSITRRAAATRPRARGPGAEIPLASEFLRSCDPFRSPSSVDRTGALAIHVVPLNLT